jgi:hypothetical protein
MPSSSLLFQTAVQNDLVANIFIRMKKDVKHLTTFFLENMKIPLEEKAYALSFIQAIKQGIHFTPA